MTDMAAWFRILVKAMLLVLPLFVAAESPLAGTILVAAPVCWGVLALMVRMVRTALREGWLGEV